MYSCSRRESYSLSLWERVRERVLLRVLTTLPLNPLPSGEGKKT